MFTINLIKEKIKNMASKSFLQKIVYSKDIMEAKSIAAQARENIFMYRVGISQSVGDINLAIAINKYIETMCCIFTMIVSGINPVIKNNAELKDVIKKISAESLAAGDKSIEYTDIFNKMKMLSTEYVTHSDEEEHLPRIGKYARSEEASAGKNKNNNNNHNKNKVVNNWTIDPRFSEKIEKKPGYPTILKITFHVNGGDIVVPIAVKANVISNGRVGRYRRSNIFSGLI
jgi:hypothetical protein